MRISAAVLTLAILLAACSGGASGSTPESTFEAVKSAAAARDWASFYDLFSPSERAKAERVWKEQKKEFDTAQGNLGLGLLAGASGLDAEKIRQMTFREFFVALLGAMMERSDQGVEQITRFAKARITDKKVEGDRATLKYEAGGKEDELELVKEGGAWYMGGELLKDVGGK